MLKIRRPLGRLIFNMGIAIPDKTVFLIETTPRSQFQYKNHLSSKTISVIDIRQWRDRHKLLMWIFILILAKWNFHIDIIFMISFWVDNISLMNRGCEKHPVQVNGSSSIQNVYVNRYASVTGNKIHATTYVSGQVFYALRRLWTVKGAVCI